MSLPSNGIDQAWRFNSDSTNSSTHLAREKLRCGKRRDEFVAVFGSDIVQHLEEVSASATQNLLTMLQFLHRDHSHSLLVLSVKHADEQSWIPRGASEYLEGTF